MTTNGDRPDPPASSGPNIGTAPAGSPAEPASQIDDDAPPLRLLSLSLLALITGAVAGLGAVVFRKLIGFVHNILFLGHFSFAYDALKFTPTDPWGPLVVLVPVIGAVAVTWLVSNFAPEAKGHGVPEVMDAIYYKRGMIRPVVALIKSVASAIALGSGAAVGREGPIIQIGAALGSTLGQVIRMQPGQRITLVAAGAGAGIAATFNTPIGGVMFASELMMPEISVNTFLPVAIATGTATFIGRLFFGSHPAFNMPTDLAPMPDVPSSAITLALYVLLGALIGLAAAAFVHGLQLLEDMFNRIPGSYLRHCLGMLLIGLLMYGFWRTTGHYYIEGVGYATIEAAGRGQITGIGLMLMLFVGKLFATCTSLGSGSSGGIFSPSLFMGSALGLAFSSVVIWAFPAAPITRMAFAIVGMGAMVGGSTGAAMTAVTMIFEMTRDYFIVLPMILAVATAIGIRRMLTSETIYTMKLARRGHIIPKALHANLFLVKRAAEIMERNVLVADATTLLPDFLQRVPQGAMQCAVVMRNGDIIGWLRIDIEISHALSPEVTGLTVGDLAHQDYTLVRETDAVFQVMQALSRKSAQVAIIVDKIASPGPKRVLGIITKDQVGAAVMDSMRISSG